MTPAEILTALRRAGARVAASGRRLRVSAPPGAIPPEVRAALQAQAGAVYELARRRIQAEQAVALGVPPALGDGALPYSLEAGGDCYLCGAGPGWALAYDDSWRPVCVRCADRLVPDVFLSWGA